MRNLGHRRDIGNAHGRVGRRLSPHQYRLRRYSLLQCIQVGEIRRYDLDAHALKVIAGELCCAWIVSVTHDETIA